MGLFWCSSYHMFIPNKKNLSSKKFFFSLLKHCKMPSEKKIVFEVKFFLLAMNIWYEEHQKSPIKCSHNDFWGLQHIQKVKFLRSKKNVFRKSRGQLFEKKFFWVVGLKKNFKAKFLTHFKTRVRKFGPIPDMSSYLNLEFWPLTTLFRPFLRGRGVYNGSEKWVAGFKNFKNYSQKKLQISEHMLQKKTSLCDQNSLR